MAEEKQASSSQDPAQGVAPQTVSVQIVSPSVGVNRPLSFPALPVSTTVQQLKEKIRNTLPTKPANDQQRLIHRGRLLARDAEALQDIFGAEALRSGEQQTLHLVLRDQSEPHAFSQQPTPVRGQSPAAATLPGRPPESQLPTNPQTTFSRLGRATPVQGIPNVQVPIPDFVRPTLASQMQMMHNQHEAIVHQTTVQWMNQIQREAGYRNLLNQQQRDRAAMGMHGVADNTAQGSASGDNLSGRNSPAPGQPVHVTREMIGPNGQYLRMTMGDAMVGSRSNSPQPASLSLGRRPLTPSDVQHIVRNADAGQATRTMTDAMHRSASGASLANMAHMTNMNGPIQPIPPGVTVPLFPNGSRHGSRTATPDPAARTPSHGSSAIPTVSQNNTQTQPSQGQPEVYLLSSPSGPRALLLNRPSEMYYTPLLYRSARRLRANIPVRQPVAQPQGHHEQTQGQRGGPQRQNANQGFPQGIVRIQPHAHNPGAGALLAVAWPHIWLLIRLTAFVWWFTAYDTSWSRWFAVVSIAIAVFAFNTGLLNGVANQAWEPFRRHLEGLIPFADPTREGPARHGQEPPRADDNNIPGPEPAPGAGPTPPGQASQTTPDPAAAARRLVAEHREANANRLLNRVRRLERAGLLFLASIAPGVAERHIAQLEAQERAERVRREAEEAAEATAREAAAAAAADAASSPAAGEEEGAAEGPEEEGAAAGEGAVPTDGVATSHAVGEGAAPHSGSEGGEQVAA